MITKTISVKATILNLPDKPFKQGYMVARYDITLGKPELWYYGLYESIERAQQVAYEIRNGVVLEIGEDVCKDE